MDSPYNRAPQALLLLAEDLLAFQEANQPTKVVIDFSILGKMMGTPMVIDLVRFKRKADAAGCDVYLCGLNESLQAFYELSSLKSSFPVVFASRAAALSSLSSSH